MQLKINGELRGIPDDVVTVSDLLRFFHLEQKILVVEWNRTIVESAHYETTRLTDGDEIEIVHFVGGG